MSLSLENLAKITLDEKMRGYWLVRTSASSEHEIAGIRIVTEGIMGLSALKRAIQQTIGSRWREEVRADCREQEDRARDRADSAGDNFRTFSDGKESESEADLESLDEQDLWYATYDRADCQSMIGLREARKKLQHATQSRRFFKNDDNGRERVTSNRPKSVQGLKKVTRCSRCGYFGPWAEGTTAGDHHRVIDPARAEGSENNRAQGRGHRTAKEGAKAKVGESILKRPSNSRILPW